MFGKKGQQLSVAILGVVIFIGMIGILYQVDKSVKELRTMRETIDDDSLSLHIHECLESEIKKAVSLVASQGGYSSIPERSVKVGEQKIPIAVSLITGVAQLPSLEHVGMEISAMIETSISDCVDLFYQGDYEIQRGVPSARTVITQEFVTVDLEYPLTLHIGNNVKIISSWTAAVPSDLYSAYTAAKEYGNLQLEKPFIRLKPLVDISRKNGVQTTIKDIENGMALYQMIAGGLSWNFIVEYGKQDDSFGSLHQLTAEQVNVMDLPIDIEGNFLYGEVEGLMNIRKEKGNSPPLIPMYKTQNVIVGRTLLMPLNVKDADGDQLEYEILTPHPGLEITPEGYLKWGPTEYQKTTIRFRVSDGTGSRIGEMTFVVQSRWHNLNDPQWY